MSSFKKWASTAVGAFMLSASGAMAQVPGPLAPDYLTAAQANQMLPEYQSQLRAGLGEVQQLRMQPLPPLRRGECYTVFNGVSVLAYPSTPYEQSTALFIPGVRLANGDVRDSRQTYEVMQHFDGPEAVYERYRGAVIPDPATAGCYTRWQDADAESQRLNGWQADAYMNRTITTLSDAIKRNPLTPRYP